MSEEVQAPEDEGVLVAPDLRWYMKRTAQTAVYPFAGSGNVQGLMYVGLGLAGEAGEVANQIKKIARDNGGFVTPERKDKIDDELGDVGWYWLRACYELGLDPYEVLDRNRRKLDQRAAEGTVTGDRRPVGAAMLRQAGAEWEAEMAEAAGKEDVFALPLEGMQHLIATESGPRVIRLSCRSLRCPTWQVVVSHAAAQDSLYLSAMTHIMQEHTPWGRAGRE